MASQIMAYSAALGRGTGKKKEDYVSDYLTS